MLTWSAYFLHAQDAACQTKPAAETVLKYPVEAAGQPQAGQQDICRHYGGDPENVLLCGFSRGAIAVSFIGLHDDEVSQLWSAFMTHDHFDGVRQWKKTDWGSPLDTYQQQAQQ